MIVIKKYHYVIAVLILVAAVFLAMKSAAGREENAEPRAAENSVEVVFPSTAPEQEDSNAAETNAKAEEPLVGVWIPYMALDVTEKTEEAFKENFDAKLAAAKSVGANAVFVHVRPFADSLYPSEYESWSHLLTGTQGKDPGYDPMEYMVSTAHEQNMQFHAWINPLRIASTTIPPELDENGFYMQNYVNHPEYFMAYNSGIYYNPASAYIRNRIADGAAEIAEKYDVDGIHFDDYFYPTTDPAFDAADYAASGSTRTQDDWRRENVNALMELCHAAAQRYGVRFGAAPAGDPEQNYTLQYSDAARWLRQGTVDYLMPQLYWGQEYIKNGDASHSFAQLAAAWAALPRAAGVKLYAGLGAYRIGAGDGSDADSEWFSGHALADQLALLARLGVQGAGLYRYGSLFANSGAPALAESEAEAIKGVWQG